MTQSIFKVLYRYVPASRKRLWADTHQK